jgi:multiple sugar transport system substrate-binding protein
MKRMRCTFALGVMMVLVVTAAFATGQNEKGGTAARQSISVLVPTWAKLSDDVIKAFETKNNMAVEFSIIDWDQIHDKIAVASAGNTAAADVTEVDWYWVGQFSDAGWFNDLSSNLTASTKADITLLPVFAAKGKTLAVPYSNDFRIIGYNKKQFDQAGISSFPATWDDLVAAARKIKAAGVSEYPLGFMLAAFEETTTNFLLFALARSGGMFGANNSLNEANTLATFKFIDQLLHADKLVDPNMVSMKIGEVNQSFLNGVQTINFGGWPGIIATSNDTTQSKVSGQVAVGLMPGHDNVRTVTYGLPEGVGIPLQSKNKAAAWKFIEFFVSAETQMDIWKVDQVLPTRVSVLQQLVKAGSLEGGDAIVEQAKAIAPLFPAGTPSWYPQFSVTLQNLVFQLATGATTAEDATRQIAKRVAELQSSK